VAQRKPSNPLALAILSLLHEKPMHPYEIGATMRQRKLSDTIKLNTGSLYAVVESLLRGGWIEPVAVEREGRHPERTIYAPTEAGKELFFSWLRSLLRTPAKEYPQFAAGLSFLGHLPPDEVKRLLAERLQKIHAQLEEMRASLKEASASGVDRLFLIETEYTLAMMEAERSWVESVIREIRDGTLTKLWGKPH
jgi:DNA-binding PadR family transcriptional regulator